VKTIVFAAAASKEFDALPKKVQERIMDALTDYAIHGVGDVKRLSARPGYRLRVGSYRVIFHEDQANIHAIFVGTRTTDTYTRN
jgi:mRNA interferase RelE/StbE